MGWQDARYEMEGNLIKVEELNKNLDVFYRKYRPMWKFCEQRKNEKLMNIHRREMYAALKKADTVGYILGLARLYVWGYLMFKRYGETTDRYMKFVNLALNTCNLYLLKKVVPIVIEKELYIDKLNSHLALKECIERDYVREVISNTPLVKVKAK